jgi:transposase
VVLESAGRIIPVGCWAHARRNFFDARLNQPRETHYVLGLVAQLYDIEDEIRLLGSDQRRAIRQERSVPVLDRLEAYLREQKDGALPKSQYGQAIGYVLNHRDQLRRYTEDGRLEIDNNVSERTLRLLAIGRNYAQFPFMRSSIEVPLSLGCRAAALLRIIRRASPGIETALTALCSRVGRMVFCLDPLDS